MRVIVCTLLVCISSTLVAAEEAAVAKITSSIEKQQYDKLGRFLTKEAGKSVRLNELQKIAEEKEATPLFDAVKTSRQIYANKGNLPISKAEIVQAGLFIETGLSKFTEQEQYYVSKKQSGLAYNLEHDPKTNNTFIILKGKNTHLGAGKKKTVSKAIHYTHNNPQVVARAEQTDSMHKEMNMTKKMRYSHGIFKTLGFGKHEAHGKTYKTVYSKMYSPGSLRDALDSRVRLSMYEKMRASVGILRGLSSLHKKGIAHRDLGDGNYLIDIPKGKPGARKVTACIADLGRAAYTKDLKNSRVQFRTTFTAPEGLDIKKLKGKDYLRTDVFACGCALYRIFYGKMGKWQDISYVKDAPGSLYTRTKVLTARVKKATKARRNALAEAAKYRTLSPKSQFELLILQMLHTDPFKRGTAQENHQKLKEIFARVSVESPGHNS